MHLSVIESAKLLELLDLVTEFVIEEDGFLVRDEVLEESPDSLALKTLEYAAQFPDVFDRLLSAHIDTLSTNDVDTLLRWKAGFFNATGTILCFTESGNALFQTEMGLVEITGITHEIDEMIPETPCTASTVLLPFAGHVVFGRSILSYAIVFGPGIQKNIRETLLNIGSGETRVLTDADEYLSVLRDFKGKQREQEFEDLARKAHRKALKDRGEEPLPKGVHRGALAGIAAGERESIIVNELEGAIPGTEDLTLVLAMERAIRHAPRRKTTTALADLDRFDLENAAIAANCQDLSGSKADIIERIAAALKEPEPLHAFMAFCDDQQFEFFCDLVGPKGRVHIEKNDDDALVKAQPVPPFTFLFYDDEEECFTGCLYEEVTKLMNADELIEGYQAHLLGRRLIHWAEMAAALYGIIAMDEFAVLLRPLVGWDDAESSDDGRFVASILVRILDFQDCEYHVEFIEDELFLVHPFLSAEFNANENGETPDGFFEFRDYLLERHRKIDRFPLELAPDDVDFYDWVMSFESARLLQDWLDAHVPDDADDYGFAEKIMEEILFSTQGPSNANIVPQLLLDAYGNVPDLDDTTMDMINDVLSLAMRFVNDIPVWSDNGYSPTALHETTTGHKLFYNEDGTMQKVGRNDPCPCGSGKKYKKCCGR